MSAHQRRNVALGGGACFRCPNALLKSQRDCVTQSLISLPVFTQSCIAFVWAHSIGTQMPPCGVYREVISFHSHAACWEQPKFPNMRVGSPNCVHGFPKLKLIWIASYLMHHRWEYSDSRRMGHSACFGYFRHMLRMLVSKAILARDLVTYESLSLSYVQE